MKAVLKRAKESLIGAFSVLGLVLNTLVLFPLLMLFVLLRITTWGRIKVWFRKLTFTIAESWVSFNSWWLRSIHKKNWVANVKDISKDKWYLVISNHKSWADIVIIQAMFDKRIPLLKFFIKKQLMWVPLMGLVWWGLEFPFMSRYSKEKLEKNPKLKGKDLAKARKMSERSKDLPMAIFSFPEGTRYTAEKAKWQNTPYQNLLKPKAGGLATSVKVLNEKIQDILDVTLVYGSKFTEKPVNFWDFLCGRIDDIKIQVNKLQVPTWMRDGDYEEDAEYKQKFQTWLAELWREKDEFINKTLEQEKQNIKNAN